ncbi:MAG: hypothetical protein KYQ20_00260 [Candidatus Nealsonbacteria bacterium]|nr:hypothetical protein [Candidatus Nealsonbacteria bacterium]
MGLEAKKREGENSQTLVRRFAQRVRKSGILRLARKIRFRERPKSRQMKKKAALRREEMKKEYEKMKKLGKAK